MQKCTSKIIAETDVKFHILSNNLPPDAYGKVYLASLAQKEHTTAHAHALI